MRLQPTLPAGYAGTFTAGGKKQELESEARWAKAARKKLVGGIKTELSRGFLGIGTSHILMA